MITEFITGTFYKYTITYVCMYIGNVVCTARSMYHIYVLYSTQKIIFTRKFSHVVL